ncbi:MAG: peptidyl-alpha-hydroxyglycine alpha-amidating lyase family protein [Vicinamibacterales bacterium]|nr:peptidyl-alpha-hydroxyglycine alpha-amidating lyase family protein [Vicinamibacterales bacterium]
MTTRTSILILLIVLVLVAVEVSGQRGAAAPGGGGAPAPPASGTDPAEIAEALTHVQHGPALPHRLVPNWPTLPKGYNFGEGTGVDIDRQGNVWVANRGAWPIMQFDKSGKMLQAWNHDTVRVTEGTGRGTHGLKIDVNGNVWLGDVDGSVNFKFSPEGRLLMILGNRQGSPNGNDSKTGFNRPTNFWPLANGNMLISDGYGNSRIAEFTNDGDYVRHFGTAGNGDGQFTLPHGVTMDAQGRIYVADRGNSRVQVFDRSGKFLAKWTDLGQPWDVYYAAQENAIYMCDGRYNRVTKLSTEGKVLGELSHFGHGPGELDFAHAIAVTPDGGDIYVVDIKNWRVQKWSR